MEKLFGALIALVGLFLIPMGIGIPMVIVGCKMASKSDPA
jgi:hypothetical protein